MHGEGQLAVLTTRTIILPPRAGPSHPPWSVWVRVHAGQLLSNLPGIWYLSTSLHTFVSAGNSPFMYLISRLLSNYGWPDCEEVTNTVSQFTALHHV